MKAASPLIGQGTSQLQNTYLLIAYLTGLSFSFPDPASALILQTGPFSFRLFLSGICWPPPFPRLCSHVLQSCSHPITLMFNGFWRFNCEEHLVFKLCILQVKNDTFRLIKSQPHFLKSIPGSMFVTCCGTAMIAQKCNVLWNIYLNNYGWVNNSPITF